MTNRISELRKKQKLSQAKLAEKMGTTRQSISMYEIEGKNGRDPSSEMWQKLANYFDVPVDYLMGVSDWRYRLTDVQWLQNYVSRQQKEKTKSVVNDPGIDINSLVSSVLSTDPDELNIVGDDSKTEAALKNAQSLDVFFNKLVRRGLSNDKDISNQIESIFINATGKNISLSDDMKKLANHIAAYINQNKSMKNDPVTKEFANMVKVLNSYQLGEAAPSNVYKAIDKFKSVIELN